MGFLSRLTGRGRKSDPVQDEIRRYAGLTVQEYVELDPESRSTADMLVNLGFLQWNRRMCVLEMTPTAEDYIWSKRR